MRRIVLGLGLCVAALAPATAAAHAPEVSDAAASTPQAAIVLEDPTLSRAIGATISEPGEVDWYRLDLEAGDPLVVGMTAPDAAGGLPATLTLVGPGLPPAAEAGPTASGLAEAAGVDGAIAFQPAADPPRGSTRRSWLHQLRRHPHGGTPVRQLLRGRLRARPGGDRQVRLRTRGPRGVRRRRHRRHGRPHHLLQRSLAARDHRLRWINRARTWCCRRRARYRSAAPGPGTCGHSRTPVASPGGLPATWPRRSPPGRR